MARGFRGFDGRPVTRLASGYVALERFEAAETILLETYRALAAAESPNESLINTISTSLDKLYKDWRRPEALANWRQANNPAQPTASATTTDSAAQ